jgi:hypothetical protein
MDKAAIERLLAALYDAPRSLRALLPGASRAVLVKVANYLRDAGLARVRQEGGVLVASISAAGRAFVQRADGRNDPP